MAAHWLIYVHCVQAWSIKSSKPHISNNAKFYWAVRIFEIVSYFFAPFFVSNVFLPSNRVCFRTSHYYFQESFFVVIAFTFWFQFYYFVVGVNADAPAHADNHSLSI